MRKNQSSLTAIGISIARAVESEKPAGERICYDPFAKQFVPTLLYYLLRLFLKSGYAELRGPGVNSYLVVRERYIDDVLKHFLDNGLQQLVILGAGFDSRAYRLNLQKSVITFEVDHPVTQAGKLKKVNKIFGKIPENVRYVAVDFNTQSLPEQLLTAGYNSDLVTLFIWQGVTMYLQSEAVDDVLGFIVNNSHSGSAVVFDYVYQAALDGIQKQREISNMRRYSLITGETLTFGISEGTVETFLLSRGFQSVKDLSTGALKAAYFTGINAQRAIVGGYGIVTGTV